MEDVERLLGALDKRSVADCRVVLSDFNSENEKVRNVDWMSKEEKVKLWDFIFRRLNNPVENSDILCQLLNTLRILSREKETLELVMNDCRVECLLYCSALAITSSSVNQYESVIKPQERLHGMKVIFNMVFQSEKLQELFIAHGLLHGLVHQVEYYDETPLDVQYFLLKTFFIVTALYKGSGAIVRNDLNGMTILINYIEEIGKTTSPYDRITAEVISEALKVLYNVIHNIFPNKTELEASMYEPEDFSLLCKMCRVVRRNLLHDTTTSEKKMEIDNHSIHLLTSVPYECYEELLTDVAEETPGARQSEPVAVYAGKDLSAIEGIVSLLNVKLGNDDRTPAEPLLLVLYRLAKKNRIIRKYLKRRILPPLTKQDLMERPEIGTTLRNKLCAVIHTPCGYCTEVAVNLLFVLCKEKVRTLVKYTGYGNAAGLLANRGLMLGGEGDCDYSDESDESETEEYAEIRDQINDVEGWIKPEQPPIEMTEEQKEFEAMKLVETIGKLSTSKVIQPCRIGPDGKPQPIGHVLELQEVLENSSKTALQRNDGDTDSE